MVLKDEALPSSAHLWTAWDLKINVEKFKCDLGFWTVNFLRKCWDLYGGRFKFLHHLFIQVAPQMVCDREQKEIVKRKSEGDITNKVLWRC